MLRDYDQADLWDIPRLHMAHDVHHHDRGLNNDGVLPGGLKVARLYPTGSRPSGVRRERKLPFEALRAALATSEERTPRAEQVVTAPTCGISSGVLRRALRSPLVDKRLPPPYDCCAHWRASSATWSHNALDRSRRRGRMPGRDRRGVRHGGSCGVPAHGRHPHADRVCRRDGPRAPSGTDARPRADWCRYHASSAMPWRRPAPSTRPPSPYSPTASTAWRSTAWST